MIKQWGKVAMDMENIIVKHQPTKRYGDRAMEMVNAWQAPDRTPEERKAAEISKQRRRERQKARDNDNVNSERKRIIKKAVASMRVAGESEKKIQEIVSKYWKSFR